ncbi:flagellar hook-associated protein FlgK [Psychromonas sp.]|nr:flagellar hook-associated protein FlgK [Psychromonas sp.]
MADLFQIGLSGIYSSQANLATTGHNISNVNTEGYSRQTVQVSTAGADRFGEYFIGRGSIVTGINRAYDQFAFTENIMNTSKYAYNQEVYMQNNQLDMVLSNEATSATKPVLEMFSSLNGVADHPNMLESRSVFLENASNMVNQYNTLYKSLEIQYSGINADIEVSADTITALAANIASMNTQISSVTNSAGTGNANDLLDQRDQAITELSELVNVSVVASDSGTVNVYIGSGQALVMGGEAQTMIAVNGDPDPSRKELAMSIKGKAIVVDGSRLGGKVSALFDTRENDIERAFNQLGQNVIGLTHSINEQQKQGQTLDGEIGAELFNDINSTDSMQSRVLSHSDGFGTADLSVRIDDLSLLSADEFTLVVDDYDATAGTLSFTVTNNTTGDSESVSLTDLTTNKRIEIPNAGFSIGIDSISTTDPLVAGKEFTLRPTRLAAQEMSLMHKDPSLVAAADAEIKAVVADTNTGTAEFRVSAINDKLDLLYMDADNPLTIKITDNTAGVIEYDIVDKNGTIVTDPTTNTALTGLTTTIDALSGKAVFSIGGIEVEMEAGDPDVGDSVTLNFNETGEGDNRNILAMADLQSAKLMNGNKATFQDVYSGMLSEIGAKTANADVLMQSSAILKNQSFERIQSNSGVNMDEEAANLLMYQQHYSAAARVISIAGELFDTILQSSA